MPSIAACRSSIAVVAALLLGPIDTAALSNPSVEIVNAEAVVSFPDRIEFQLTAESEDKIAVAEVEYGVEMLSCATELSRAVPQDFAPSDRVDVAYTWDMRRTGSLAPGARIWWRWHVVDGNGEEIRTETEWLTWIDNVHEWDAMSSGLVTLHWYEGDKTFARTLLSAASQAFGRLADELGTQPETEIHIYVYDSTDAMRLAVLYEPGWTGGLAFSNNGIVIIGISADDLDWGQGAIAHELAHVFVGTLVSHCYSYLPSWLSEGLAVYAEGGLDEGSRQQLDEAISDNSLFSVRSLNDAFTEHEGRAFLSYAQSYSLVSYLMETFGRAKMLELLEAFQAGYRADNALLQVYDFDIEGLEKEWRHAAHATPMAEAAKGPGATATLIPTLRPLAGPPQSATLTPLPAMTDGADSSPVLQTSESASRALGILLMSCSVILLVSALAVVGLRRKRRKPDEVETLR